MRNRVNQLDTTEGVRFCSVRLTTIFDTSAILTLSKRDSSDPALNRLISSAPQHGWPLSFITVVELLNGLSRGSVDQFDESLKPVRFAARLSRRSVLWQSIPFVQKELFNIVDRRHQVSTENLKRYLGKLQQPNAKDEFTAGKFTFLPKIEALVNAMRRGYKDFMGGFLDEKMPNWRTEREKSGSPLPKKEREKLKCTLPVEKWKRDVAMHFVAESFNGRAPDAHVRLVSDRCDAYLTFTVSVLRDAFMTGYRFEDNANDFHDEMQLLYLARPWFCLVTEDTRWIGRTRKSSQSDRIVTIDQFVSRAKLKYSG
jgi:hypothetical protein